MCYPFSKQKAGTYGINPNFGPLGLRKGLHEMDCFGMMISALFVKQRKVNIHAALVTAYGRLLPLGKTP